MAEAGWTAQGLLRPLWNRYEGGRDSLAAAVGTKGTVLSSINSGKRPLGHDLAGRLADELGISLAELGAPEAKATDEASRSLFARLTRLEKSAGALIEGQHDGLTGQETIRAELAAIREILDARLPDRRASSQGGSD